MISPELNRMTGLCDAACTTWHGAALAARGRILKLIAMSVSGLVCAAFLSLGWPAQAQDSADAFVRVQRLEAQMRQMSGQIEQLQFENRRLQDQLKRFQDDVEFRFQEQGGRGAARPAGQPAGQPAVAPAPRPRPPRGDAFDPSSQPAAPGAPRALGGGSSSLPASPQGGGVIEEDASAGGPLDLSAASRPAGQSAGTTGQPPALRQPSIAAAGAASAREEYDQAYGLVLQKDYEAAEMGMRRFLQSFPRDRLAPDAVYWLGESYYQRQRHREAAEQFLKVSTDYPRAGKAPDSLVRLAASLNALGAREQACATLSEVGRKYPNASQNVRAGVEREQRRARCTA